MTFKEKTALLWQYQAALQAEQKAIDNVELAQAAAERVTQTLSGMPRGGRVAGSDKMPEAVERIMAAKEQLATAVRKAMNCRKNVLAVINSDTIKNEQWRIMLLRRYILGQRWKDIAAAMEITYEYLNVLHKKAIASILNDAEL